MGEATGSSPGERHDVAVFHPGVQHSWQTALALQQLGRLSFYATSIFYQPTRWPYRVERYLPAPLARRAHREFTRFAGPALDPDRVHSFGAAEWLERMARRAGAHRLAARLDAVGNRRFAAGLDGLMSRQRPSVLWGYDNASLEMFGRHRQTGCRCVLDRTIGDMRAYRDIMAPVFDRYPEFVVQQRVTIPQATIDRADAEYATADRIVVGSAFAAATVRAHAPHVAARVRVLPYCFDQRLFAGAAPRPPRTGPVRFLFLGQAGMRKGIHLILNVMGRLPAGDASLTIVGDLQIPPAIFARHADRVFHRRSIPRAQVPDIMAAHDVLLFPSYFEGAGIVLYEALAMGCALIQSKNCADAATPETGLVLPELSEAALEEAMTALIADRARLRAMQAAAPTDAQRFSFARYRDGVAGVLDGLA